MIPFKRWPEETMVILYPDQCVSVNAPEGETRYCYVTLKKKHSPTQNICVRVAGTVQQTRKALRLKE